MSRFRWFLSSLHVMLLIGILSLGTTSTTAQAQYYNVCNNFRGLNNDYRNCLYAAPHQNSATSRDIILPGELRRTVFDWCRVTAPWQRQCFKSVTSHCDNAANLANLADSSGLCNNTQPASWVNDVIRHFARLDRTCLDFLPDDRPLVAGEAEDIRMFKELQKEHFEVYLVNMWFRAMESDCHHKDELFHYRLITDLLTSDLGINYIDELNTA